MSCTAWRVDSAPYVLIKQSCSFAIDYCSDSCKQRYINYYLFLSSSPWSFISADGWTLNVRSLFMTGGLLWDVATAPVYSSLPLVYHQSKSVPVSLLVCFLRSVNHCFLQTFTWTLRLRFRCRNKQTRLFMIQRQIMAILGLSRRPNVPAQHRRNVTDADIERLLPLLQQPDTGDDADAGNDTARLYVVKRVHALLPTCT